MAGLPPPAGPSLGISLVIFFPSLRETGLQRACPEPAMAGGTSKKSCLPPPLSPASPCAGAQQPGPGGAPPRRAPSPAPPQPLHPLPICSLPSHSFAPLQPRGSQPGLEGRCCHRAGQEGDSKSPEGRRVLAGSRGGCQRHIIPSSFPSLHTGLSSRPGRQEVRSILSLLQVRRYDVTQEVAEPVGHQGLDSPPQIPGLLPLGEPPGLMVGWAKLGGLLGCWKLRASGGP